jgi:GNAT superfamily N-acetyltransferase
VKITPEPPEIVIAPTRDVDASYQIAARLPDYFTESGLKALRADLARGEPYGAFVGGHLVGFTLYKEINPEAVEMAWLAVDREHWSHGVGTKLVTEILRQLAGHYRACEVKTLAATVSDPGYARTRRFYAKLGFIPLEVIDPYPGWEPGNPCQIMVRFLGP